MELVCEYTIFYPAEDFMVSSLETKLVWISLFSFQRFEKYKEWKLVKREGSRAELGPVGWCTTCGHMKGQGPGRNGGMIVRILVGVGGGW